MALAKNEVIHLAKAFLDQIRRKYDLRDAYLFGSFAKRMPAGHSEVDLAIVLYTFSRFEESFFDDQSWIFHEAQEFNSRIEVVCFPKDEFDQDGGTLARRLKKNGGRHPRTMKIFLWYLSYLSNKIIRSYRNWSSNPIFLKNFSFSEEFHRIPQKKDLKYYFSPWPQKIDSINGCTKI